MREELSSLMNNQTWTFVDLSLGRKAIRCGWMNKAKKKEYGAVYRLKSRLVAKNIPRSQKSTIMASLRLLKTKWFSDSSLLLPCILNMNFFSWTSTLPIYIGTWKKPYTWSNKRVLMMDQAECVYCKSAFMASNNREENGTFDSQISWLDA